MATLNIIVGVAILRIKGRKIFILKYPSQNSDQYFLKAGFLGLALCLVFS
jgi:hypothetical protein